MRDTDELVQELQTEAEEAEMAALIVVFESTTLYVFSNTDDASASLAQMVEFGGRAVGLLRITTHEGRRALKVRPLQEYEEDVEVQSFLKDLALNMLKRL